MTLFEDLKPGMRCVYHRTFPQAQLHIDRYGRVTRHIERILDAPGPIQGVIKKLCRKSKMVRIEVVEAGITRELVVRDKYLVV